MIVPMYVAECSPPELRGLLIGVQQFAIEFGIMVSFWIVSTDETVEDFALINPGLWDQLYWRNRQRSI